MILQSGEPQHSRRNFCVYLIGFPEFTEDDKRKHDLSEKLPQLLRHQQTDMHREAVPSVGKFHAIG